MNSRQRLIKTLNHEQTDKVVMDIGATPQTGISASVLYQLREALGLEKKPVTVHEPFQILGQVDEDLRQAIGVDVVGLFSPYNAIGMKNENWKPWSMPDGTPTLVAEKFEYDVKDGDTYIYPQGDRSCEPSMILPEGGYFFDAINRSKGFDEDNLNGSEDFQDDFSLYTDEVAKSFEEQANHYFSNTQYGIIGNFAGMALGDAGALPGQFLKEVKGIRKMDDWLMAHMLWPDYIKEIFELQTEIALKNLEIYKQAVGDKIQVITVSPTDFGTQNREIISPDSFRQLYKPYYKKVNNWIHKNTNWKVFFHTCGSIYNLLDDLHECGVDVLNPVQCSATGMEPDALKEEYGDKFVFWGGGVDTQQTLPFGTPQEVREEVAYRIKTFNNNGGFVFSTIHNIVGKTPIENLLALLDEVKQYK